MARIIRNNGITYGNSYDETLTTLKDLSEWKEKQIKVNKIYDTLSTRIDNRIAALEESEYVSIHKIDTVQNNIDTIYDRINILEEQINKKNKRVIKIKIRG